MGTWIQMGRKTVSGAAAEQRGKDCTLGPDGVWGTNSGREGGGNQNVCSQTGALGYPSLAIWTAQVTSSSPRVVAYTSFSSLTFASGFSKHWGGERTCPQVKAAQLKFPPKLSGCPWASGSQPPSFDAHPHQNEQREFLLVEYKAVTILNQIKTYFHVKKQFLQQERNCIPHILSL